MSKKEYKEFILEEGLKKELEAFRKKRGFDAKEWVDTKCKMLNEHMKKCGLKGAVINCSGGIDSGTTIALIHRASKMEGSPIEKIIGIGQPIHSTPEIQNRAYKLKPYADEIITVDQTKIFDNLVDVCEKASKIKGKVWAKGMLKSYMRTPVAYYIAQCLNGDGIPSCVFGTGNFDEDGYLYYFCKAGDGIADIQLINELHKSEVFAIGHVLELPESILIAKPSADLWPGQTDEGELGFSYDFVELYTEYLNTSKKEREAFRARLDEKSKKQFLDTEPKIVDIHRKNRHKENYPYNLNVKKFELFKEKKD